MIESLQDFVGGFPEWLQWVAVALVAMIPFVESYLGTGIGVFAGMNPFVAASAAIVGNLVVVLVLIAVASRVRAKVKRGDTAPVVSARREKVARMFERFGVPGVSLLVHPTQVSSVVMVGLGANRAKVVLWQIIAIVLWAGITGTLATFGANVLMH